MAHNLFGKRFVGVREPAWHKLGTVIPEGQDITAVEAVKLGKIDFQYHKIPTGFEIPEGYADAGGTILSESRYVLLREPTEDDPEWVELGVVGPRYEVLQNLELAEGLDRIARQNGWTFETVGALGRGEEVFMCLKTGERDVVGDQYTNYLGIVDGKGNGRALSLLQTKVRMVCENTVMAAKDDAKVHVKLGHDQDVRNAFGPLLDYVAAMKRSEDAIFLDLEVMASRKITDDEAKGIFSAAFAPPPMSAKAQRAEAVREMEGLSGEQVAELTSHLQDAVEIHQYYQGFYAKRQEAAFELYQRINSGDEQGGKLPAAVLKKISQTPYAALQAATELVDWGGHANEKVAARSSIFGHAAQMKKVAYKEALKVARAA